MPIIKFTAAAFVSLAFILTGLSCGNSPPKETPVQPLVSGSSTEAIVYKSPTCGCCGRWENHLTENGFKVNSQPTSDMKAVKDKLNIPSQARSCHTATIGGYVVEGHVPAEDIKSLLQEHPAGVVGIAVPGMPVGSPGMEGPNPQHYDVVTFDGAGKTAVYRHH